MKTQYLDKVLDGYLECAQWCGLSEDYAGKGPFMFTQDAIKRSKTDILKFIMQSLGFLEELDPEQIGHDFWLTRNHHGTGFWDRGIVNGEKLTEIARTLPEVSIYLNDNNEIEME